MKIIVSLFLSGVVILSAGYITPPLQAVLDTLSPGNKTKNFLKGLSNQ